MTADSMKLWGGNFVRALPIEAGQCLTQESTGSAFPVPLEE